MQNTNYLWAQRRWKRNTCTHRTLLSFHSNSHLNFDFLLQKPLPISIHPPFLDRVTIRHLMVEQKEVLISAWNYANVQSAHQPRGEVSNSKIGVASSFCKDFLNTPRSLFRFSLSFHHPDAHIQAMHGPSTQALPISADKLTHFFHLSMRNLLKCDPSVCLKDFGQLYPVHISVVLGTVPSEKPEQCYYRILVAGNRTFVQTKMEIWLRGGQGESLRDPGQIKLSPGRQRSDLNCLNAAKIRGDWDSK